MLVSVQRYLKPTDCTILLVHVMLHCTYRQYVRAVHVALIKISKINREGENSKNVSYKYGYHMIVRIFKIDLYSAQRFENK